MNKSMLSLSVALMLGAPALWAQLGTPVNNNQGNQPQAQQGQVPQQQPVPAQAAIIPANPVAKNAQEVQQSKQDLKKVQASEVKTLADIQKSEDQDLDAIKNNSTLSVAARQSAEKQVRLKYEAMRKDLRTASNKTQKLEEKNKRNAKTAEIKAEKKTANGQ